MVLRRHGQVAIEYLMTYGWALIALAIVLGALYMAFFPNPQELVPEACSFTDDFTCLDAMVTRNGLLNMSLRNLVGTRVNVTNVICDYGGESYTTINNINNIGSGEQFYAFCGTGEMMEDKLVRLRVHVDYIPEGFLFERRVTGSVTARPR